MPLDFPKLNDSDIIQLSKNSNADVELYKLTFGELQLLNEKIEKMAKKYQDNFQIFSDLMQLKTHSIHIANYARKRDQEYR
jgi:hypothetical protein